MHRVGSSRRADTLVEAAFSKRQRAVTLLLLVIASRRLVATQVRASLTTSELFVADRVPMPAVRVYVRCQVRCDIPDGSRVDSRLVEINFLVKQ